MKLECVSINLQALLYISCKNKVLRPRAVPTIYSDMCSYAKNVRR
jgi:hypothetical protein